MFSYLNNFIKASLISNVLMVFGHAQFFLCHHWVENVRAFPQNALLTAKV